jgi:hypothetical protein
VSEAPSLSDADIERFWSKVDRRGDDECWLWTGSKLGGGGHGGFTIRSRKFYAHRISFFMETGSWPGDLCVLHSCDVARCCNPSHLRMGTQTDNMRDRTERGRHWVPVGEACTGSKLTVAAVLDMRERHAAGERTSDLADSYGVSEITAYFAISRRSWKHIP